MAVTAEAMLLLLMAIYAAGGLVAASTSWGSDLVLMVCNIGMIVNFALLWTYRKSEGDRSLSHWIWGKEE